MDEIEKSRGLYRKVMRYTLLLCGGWTLLFILILYYQISDVIRHNEDLARNEARVHFNWIRSFRHWVAKNGGVYVPIEAGTPPNKYLDIPERDIQTPAGKKLTLVNPAYMTRQVFEQYGPQMQIHGHLTSLRPIRPLNKADEWEDETLKTFEEGADERQGYSVIGGETYLRLMRPLHVKKPCLSCHAKQGYKEGDVRGGISISVPFEKYHSETIAEIEKRSATLAFLWLLGFGLISFGSSRILRQTREREKVENSLRETNILLNRVFSSVHNMIAYMDAGYNFIKVNHAFAKTDGKDAEFFIGKNYFDLHPDDGRKEIFNGVIETGEPHTAYAEAFESMSPGSGACYFDWSIHPVCNESGATIGLVLSMVNVTGRKNVEDELRGSEGRLRAITSSVQDAIIMIDGEGRVTFWNPASEKIFGYSSEEISGKKLHDFIIPEDRVELHKKGLSRFKSSGSGPVIGSTVEQKALRKNGVVFPIELSISALWRGDCWHAVGVIRDITDRKLAAEALVKEKEKAEEATREKDRYVSLIAHDLKTPFASIIGFLQYFLQDKQKTFSEEERAIFASLLESCAHTMDIVEEVLHTSRFKTGQVRLKLRFFDASLAVESVMTVCQGMAAKKSVSLNSEVPEGFRLYADPALFREVLQNLLSNAIKFCRKGDTVTFYVPPGESSCVAVRDTGVGMDEDIVSGLFRNDLKTTMPGTNGEKGTGLGLPFCHEIMTAHSGSLEVESVKGAGSVFFVRVPYVKPSVLVVDDEKIARHMLKGYLESIDVNVAEAGNGEEALELVERRQPHLILCDILMPSMDGFETLKALKASVKTMDIPVIILTSDNRIETSEKAMRLGADDFLSKPIERQQLIPRVRKFIV